MQSAFKKNRAVSVFLIFFSLSFASVLAADLKPKYGPPGHPRATPIAISHDYFRDHPSPDYWALSGYYVPQFNGYACSVASVVTVLNAARAHLPKTADDKVITQKDILEKITTEHWKQVLSPEGFQGMHGLTLERLGKVVEESFKAYGFPKVRVHVVHIENTLPDTKKKVLAMLEENEKSTKDFVIAGFDQKLFTDDTEAGHFAPVGAFDSIHGRVLIFDPDREYYEPYWISVDTFISGMATQDRSAQAYRGYVLIQP